MTFETWIKSNNTSYPSDIVSYDSFQLNITSNILWLNITGKYSIAGYGIQSTLWQHVAFTYNGSTINLYLNGVLLESTTSHGVLSTTTGKLVIGNDNVTNVRSVNGIMDEVRLWNIARTQDEIIANANKELTGSEPGLVGYWKFNEGQGQVVGDSSGHGNDGQLGLTSGTETTDPKWVSIPELSSLPQLTWESVTVNSNYPGFPFTFNGVTYVTPYVFSFASSSHFKISVDPVVTDTTGKLYIFSSWSDGTAREHYVTISSPTTFTVNWSETTTVNITLDTNPSGFYVIVGGYYYMTPYTFSTVSGTNLPITVKSTQSGGGTFYYYFSSWSDGGLQKHTPCILSDTTIIANYVTAPPVTVTITSNPSGRYFGLSSWSSYTTPYSFSTSTGVFLYLSASADQKEPSGIEYDYMSWSDGGYSAHTVCINSDTSFQSIWTTRYALSGYGNPNFAGSVNPSSWWAYSGKTITCTAYPNSNYSAWGVQFSNWSGDLYGTSNPTTLVMNGPKSITANFIFTIATVQINGYCYSTPVQVSQVTSHNLNAVDLVIKGNYVYVVDPNFGFRVINISNPLNPYEYSSYSCTGIRAIDISGNYLYAAVGSGGLKIFNISNLTNIKQVGNANTSDFANGVAVNGNYAYLAAGTTGLRIYNISNPANVTETGYIITKSSAVSIAVNGNVAYVALKGNETESSSGDYWGGYYYDNYLINGGVQLYDISTPSSPKISTYSRTSSPGYSVNKEGNTLAFMETGCNDYHQFCFRDYTCYDGYTLNSCEMYFYSISSSTTLKNLGKIGYAYTNQAASATIVANNAYFCLGTHGFKILDITDSSTTYEVVNMQTTNAVKVRINGRYAYLADGMGGLRVIDVKIPIKNASLSLSGDTSLWTSTDSTGYYKLSNLPYGYYSTRVDKPNYTFLPSKRGYAPLLGSITENNYFGVYTIPQDWENSVGDFDTSSDITNWSYETPVGAVSQPSISWSSTNQGRQGNIKLTFSTQSQGIKLTCQNRFVPDLINHWHRLRITYYVDSIFQGSVLPVLLMYKSVDSYDIQEIGASYTGNSTIQAGQWYTLDTYLYARTNSGMIQVIVKNNGSPGNLYIDSIQLDYISPPAFTNSTYVSLPWEGLNDSNETTFWAFEGTQLSPGGQPTLSWVTTFSGQTGVIHLAFSTKSQGAKITSLDTFSIPTNSNAVLSFKIYSNLSSPTTLSVMGYLFAEQNMYKQIWDVAGVGELGTLPGNTWNTISVPLTSVSQLTTYRLQMIITNTNQIPQSVYIDDIELFYDTNNSTSPIKWVNNIPYVLSKK